MVIAIGVGSMAMSMSISMSTILPMAGMPAPIIPLSVSLASITPASLAPASLAPAPIGPAPGAPGSITPAKLARAPTRQASMTSTSAVGETAGPTFAKTSTLSSILTRDDFIIRLDDVWPLAAHSIAATLEVLALPALFAYEESGGFSEPDLLRFSIYGDSYLFTRWAVNGVDVTDPLFSGTPALTLPSPIIDRVTVRSGGLSDLSGSAVSGGSASHLGRSRIDLGTRTMVEPAPEEGTDVRRAGIRRAGVRLTGPRLGGITPGARGLMDALSGRHAVDRTPPPPTERPTLLESQHFFLADREEIYGRDSQYSIEIRRGRRLRLLTDLASSTDRGSSTDLGSSMDAESAARSRTFTEDHLTAGLALELVADDRASRLLLGAEYRHRSHAFTELFYAPNETAVLDTATLFVGGWTPRASLGITLKSYGIDPRDRTFTRELKDRDGEGLSPYSPDGHTLGFVLDATWRPLDVLYARSNLRSVSSSPSTTAWSNRVTFEGRDLGRIAWTSQPTLVVVGEHEIGVIDQTSSGPFDLAYRLYAFGSYALNRRLENTLVSVDAGASLTLSTPAFSPARPFLIVAKTPVPFVSEVALAVDPDYLNGAYWHDGILIDTTGGAHTTISRDLTGTNIYSVALGISLPVSEVLELRTEGLLKFHRGTLRLTLDGEPKDFGTFKEGVYYFTDGPTRYRLENRTTTPRYFGWHIQLFARQASRFIFSLAFSAYNVVGESPFGNGPGANDVGVVSFVNASPNGDQNAFANLDTDRGFMFKALLGYRFPGDLVALAALRYRDGQPFAFYDYHEDLGQVAMTQTSPRGSPLHYARPLLGPREDFQLSVDLAAEWVLGRASEDAGWAVFALASNLLDLGNELQETNDEQGRRERSSLMLQVPRSIMIGLELRP